MLRKIYKIYKDIKFLCKSFVEKGSNIPNIYYSQKELKHFDFEILVIYGILEHTVLNIFKYIFWHICFKISKEKKKNNSQIFLNYIKVRKDFSTLKLYILKVLLSKNRFYFFFVIFWHSPISPFLAMPRHRH